MPTLRAALALFAAFALFAVPLPAAAGGGVKPAAAGGKEGLTVVAVAPDTYALVGPLGQRDPANLGNNATFGLVVTPAGAVLIDAGGSRAGAAALAEVVRSVTAQPVVAVINTGGQDHRWLGNGYFQAAGARLIASAAAVDDQRQRADAQFQGMQALIGADAFAGTAAVHAGETFTDAHTLTIGGVRFELRHAGAAHTPGDAFVWLPDRRVVFTGDIVYLDRMLGVLSFSNSGSWLTAFAAVADLDPAVVVPGHGRPGDLAQARAQTGDYLAHLRGEVRTLLDAGGGIEDAANIDQSRFMTLTGADTLARRNAQQVFIELEFE